MKKTKSIGKDSSDALAEKLFGWKKKSKPKLSENGTTPKKGNGKGLSKQGFDDIRWSLFGIPPTHHPATFASYEEYMNFLEMKRLEHDADPEWRAAVNQGFPGTYPE